MNEIAQLIYDHNQSLFQDVDSVVLENFEKGTIIHSISEEEAIEISSTLRYLLTERDTKAPILPVPYVLACLAVESAFDPRCENGNFLGSNPTKELAGYDIGIAQIKLKYLMQSTKIAAMTGNEYTAWAFNLTNALTRFTETMVYLMGWAKGEHMTEPHLMATNAYNYGIQGVTDKIINKEPMPHGESVKRLEREFAKRLQLISVFPEEKDGSS